MELWMLCLLLTWFFGFVKIIYTDRVTFEVLISAIVCMSGEAALLQTQLLNGRHRTRIGLVTMGGACRVLR